MLLHAPAKAITADLFEPHFQLAGVLRNAELTLLCLVVKLKLELMRRLLLLHVLETLSHVSDLLARSGVKVCLKVLKGDRHKHVCDLGQVVIVLDLVTRMDCPQLVLGGTEICCLYFGVFAELFSGRQRFDEVSLQSRADLERKSLDHPVPHLAQVSCQRRERLEKE